VLFTDEWNCYTTLATSYQGHRRIKHRAKIYAVGDTHTQTVEGFFGLVKNGIRGVYRSVSIEYLQRYLDEYCFRLNNRHTGVPMFWAMMGRIRKTAPAEAA
jgi:hypothetical protein